MNTNNKDKTIDFWQALDELARTHRLIIDRPRGSAHPRYEDMIYPLDYGYLDGTTAGDGAGIDVWAGSDPSAGVGGILCTADPHKKDTEVKIMLGCTESEADQARRFLLEDGQLPCILVLRPPSPQGA